MKRNGYATSLFEGKVSEIENKKELPVSPIWSSLPPTVAAFISAFSDQLQ